MTIPLPKTKKPNTSKGEHFFGAIAFVWTFDCDEKTTLAPSGDQSTQYTALPNDAKVDLRRPFRLQIFTVPSSPQLRISVPLGEATHWIVAPWWADHRFSALNWPLAYAKVKIFPSLVARQTEAFFLPAPPPRTVKSTGKVSPGKSNATISFPSRISVTINLWLS